MSGGPPKALQSTGPQSLRDMPHPLAGSSSEEAVGGDSTPSPDLLTARSFGDKVGRAGLRVGRLVGLPRGDEGSRARLGTGPRPPCRPFPGGRRALTPEPWEEASPLCRPRGVAAAQGERSESRAGRAWLVSSASDSWWGGVPAR